MNAFTSRLPLLIALGLLLLAIVFVIFMLPSALPNFSSNTQMPSPTESPYMFGNQVINFISNINTLGCDWQGIGGQVLDLQGQAYLNPLMVEVSGGGLPTTIIVQTGSNTLYGASGFEIQVANGINTRTYYVQLKSLAGTAISPILQFTFPRTCEGNLALIIFSQEREP